MLYEEKKTCNNNNALSNVADLKSRCEAIREVTNFLSGGKRNLGECNDKLSFKSEMQQLISEFKNDTKESKDRYELLIVLNSILINEVIDKVDQIDKSLKEK